MGKSFHSSIVRGKKEYLNVSVAAKYGVKPFGLWCLVHLVDNGDKNKDGLRDSSPLLSEERKSRRKHFLLDSRLGILLVSINCEGESVREYLE